MPTPEDIARLAYRKALGIGLTMTTHALRRCAEMGVSPTAVARIVRDGTHRSSKGGCWFYEHEDHPLWAVVVGPAKRPIDDRAIVTVVFRERKKYERLGRTYRVLEDWELEYRQFTQELEDA